MSKGSSVVPPEQLAATRRVDGTDWREWMRNLGQRQRRLRELTGLSQAQLAGMAGVSQGAVSRLETARGLATPLLVVLKINAALARELRRFDAAMLSPELRRAVELLGALVPSDGVLTSENAPLAEDAALEEIFRLYHSAPERQRNGLLSVVRAMVLALKPTTVVLLALGF